MFYEKENPGNKCFYQIRDTTTEEDIKKVTLLQRKQGRDEMKFIITNNGGPKNGKKDL